MTNNHMPLRVTGFDGKTYVAFSTPIVGARGTMMYVPQGGVEHSNFKMLYRFLDLLEDCCCEDDGLINGDGI